jgi:hypothetical protein
MHQFIHSFGATSQFKGVYDKIGHIAKFIVANLERFGDIDSRAYTAYMFFNILLKHMKAPTKIKDGDIEEKFKKPHTAATRYITLYVASGKKDAEDKDA